MSSKIEGWKTTIEELNEKIKAMEMCEERDDLIKQREVLKWICDARVDWWDEILT